MSAAACASDADCAQGAYCADGVCLLRQANGKDHVDLDATVGSLGERVVVSHHSSCLLHRLPLWGADLTQIHGIGPFLALRLIGECGTDLSRWRTAKHFTSWLSLAPHNKISGGKVLSSRTRRSGSWRS